MKVILTDEIRGLGGRGDVVSVKDGYARNYLIPKSLAREATPGNLKAAEHEKRKWALLTMQEVEAAKVVAEALKEMKLLVYKRAGAEGTLFGSVTTNEIAEGLAEKGIELDKRRIETHNPIKSLGEHEVEAHLHREVVATFIVDVHPLGEEEQQRAAPVAAEDAAAEGGVAEDAAPTEAAEAPAEAEQEQ